MIGCIKNSKSEPKKLFIKKLETNSSASPIYQQYLHTAFTDPNSYFQANFDGQRILFGKKSNKPPYIIKSTNRKSLNARQSRASLAYNSINSSKGMISTSNNTQQSQSSLPINKYYVEDKEIKGIFDNFRNISQQNRNNDNKAIKSIIRTDDEGAILNKQKKALSNYNIFNKTAKQLSDNIAKRLKRGESKLLMTNSIRFRIKKEIKDNLLNEATVTESKAIHNFISSLRSDNDNRYINVGTINNPKWQLIVMKKNKKEIIRNPSRDNNFKQVNFINNKNYSSRCININNVKRISNSHSFNFKDLEVKGRNLLQFEYELVKGLKGKKIITKYPKYEIENNNNRYDINYS